MAAAPDETAAESRHSEAIRKLRAEWADAEKDDNIQENDRRLTWDLERFTTRAKYLEALAYYQEPLEMTKEFTYSLSFFEHRTGILYRIGKERIILPASVKERLELFSILSRGVHSLRMNVQQLPENSISGEKAVNLILELDKLKNLMLNFENQICSSCSKSPENFPDSDVQFMQNLKKSLTDDIQEAVIKLMASHFLFQLSNACDEQKKDLFLIIYMNIQKVLLKETGRVTPNFFSVYRHECKLWEDLWLKFHTYHLEAEGEDCLVCDKMLTDDFAILGGCADLICLRCHPNPLIGDCIRCHRPTKFYMTKPDFLVCLKIKEDYEENLPFLDYRRNADLLRPEESHLFMESDDDDEMNYSSRSPRLWRFYNLRLD